MIKSRRWLPSSLLILGGLLLLWAALISIKPLLSNYQIVEGDYLLFQQQVNLPLPKIASIRNTETAPEDVFHSLVHSPYTPTPTVTPTPTPVPAGPVTRLAPAAVPGFQGNDPVRYRLTFRHQQPPRPGWPDPDLRGPGPGQQYSAGGP